MKKQTTFDDICGIILTKNIDGRFQEVVSTQKIIDTKTDKQYNGLIDVELLKIINELDNENEKLKNKLERKIKESKRVHKDIEKYTDYFMRELGWDCDRIMKEVFKW